ncbi:MAG: hypothetical protein AB7O40_09915 [Pseudolabrys sp.]
MRGVAVALTVAYALFAQAFLASIVVTQAVASGDVNIICLGGDPGAPGHGKTLPPGGDNCILCSLSACSAAAGAALPVVPAGITPPQPAEARVVSAALEALLLPQPPRTPKLSQAPPHAM